jgi:membrane protein
MSITSRLDGFQRRHPSWGFPIAVVYKFFEDQGPYLAALITYYGFVSLVPLLLLLNTVLNFVLHSDPALRERVVNSALGQFPVIGNQLRDPGIGGNGFGLIVGILGTLYGGLGVGQALQNAMNTTWMVPRNSRPNPFKARARSLSLLFVLAVSVVGTTALSAIGASKHAFGTTIGTGLTVALVGVSVLVNAAIFVLAFTVATARRVSIGQVIPGALLAAVAWQLLQSFGATYVQHVVARASAVNSVFALVLGLLAWIYLEAAVVVIGAELNVVRALQVYPRALLTPFTDNVELTGADRAAYTRSAKAQRQKGFQQIDVRFGTPAEADSDARYGTPAEAESEAEPGPPG